MAWLALCSISLVILVSGQHVIASVNNTLECALLLSYGAY